MLWLKRNEKSYIGGSRAYESRDYGRGSWQTTHKAISRRMALQSMVLYL